MEGGADLFSDALEGASTSANDFLACLQGSAKRWSPGCVNAAGKARQKWQATAATIFTKPAVLIGIASTVGGRKDMAPSASWVPAMGSGIIEVLKHEHTKIG